MPGYKSDGNSCEQSPPRPRRLQPDTGVPIRLRRWQPKPLQPPLCFSASLIFAYTASNRDIPLLRRNYDCFERKVPALCVLAALVQVAPINILTRVTPSGVDGRMPVLLPAMNYSSLRAAQYLVVCFPGKSSGLIFNEVCNPKIRRVWSALSTGAGNLLVVWPEAELGRGASGSWPRKSLPAGHCRPNH